VLNWQFVSSDIGLGDDLSVPSALTRCSNWLYLQLYCIDKNYFAE